MSSTRAIRRLRMPLSSPTSIVSPPSLRGCRARASLKEIIIDPILMRWAELGTLWLRRVSHDVGQNSRTKLARTRVRGVTRGPAPPGARYVT